MSPVAALTLAVATGAAAVGQSAAQAQTMAIESCVSSGAIQFGATDQHVALEPDDHSRVLAEMERRYPVLVQHGFPVSKIILWQKTGGEALFITLLEHPRRPQESCFTATFAAARFDGIATLKRKYLRPELAS